jgi:acetyl-CoA acyltransferase
MSGAADAVIVDAVRTPLGKGKASGALAEVHPVDLLAAPLEALVERNGLDPRLVDDVVVGTVSQVGEQAFNVARRATLAAGLPESVPATTVDRQCGSSQQAISFAAQGVQAGAYDLVIAGGVESMSRVPMGSPAQGAWDIDGRRFSGRYPEGLVSQGVAAELIAAKWGISRHELDEFGLRSQELARGATDWGAFGNEMVPVEVRGADGTRTVVHRDEGLRATTLEGLAALRPAFVDEQTAARFPQIEWSITAGTSSQITDGASALLLASAERAAELGLRARARVHTTAVVGDDPLFMLTAVIPVTFKALDRAGLSLSDIDLFEVNEAFASVVLAWARETGVDLGRVNVNGGAIALGHPLGASGARLATTLVNALEQRDKRYGMQIMCEAGGLANATIYERLD